MNNTFSDRPVDLIHPSESRWFGIALVFSILSYVLFALTIVGIPIIIGIILFFLFIHGLNMAMIRQNAVKLSSEQFPELYEKLETLSNNMGLKSVPDCYVIESQGMLNAFATRFVRRNMVVVYSTIFELIEEGAEEEVLFVFAHEFAHLKRRHIVSQGLIIPFMLVPFVGTAYSRACEFTCDRMAAYYTTPSAGENGLAVLSIGKQLYRRVNVDAFIEQQQSERGFFATLSEWLSTHPPLTKRIHELKRYFDDRYEKKLKGPNATVYISIALVVLFYIGSIVWITYAVISSPWEFSEEAFATEDLSPMFLAVENSDIEELETLVNEGSSLEETNDMGQTLLHHAVAYSDETTILYLINQGLDVNAVDDYEYTPLMDAISFSTPEVVELLLENGADPQAPNMSYNAYNVAEEMGNEEYLETFE